MTQSMGVCLTKDGLMYASIFMVVGVMLMCFQFP